MNAYPLHPAAEIFPAMDDAALAALTADIAAHGQREPILMLEGQVIDGRHRLRACEELGIAPRVRELSVEDGDPIALVISLNLHRRHLTEAQRALAAARLATLPQGRTPVNPPTGGFKQSDAAALLNVGERSVQRARVVIDQGSPELTEAVDQGAVSMTTAVQLAQLPADAQRAVLTRSPDEIRAIANEVRTRIREAGVCGPSALRIFDQVTTEQGLSASEQCAVVEVIHADTPATPTPAEARRLAVEGPPGLLVAATDGRFYAAPGDPEENARMARWLRLREGLESLGTLPFSAQTAIESIPAYQHRNVADWLAVAVPLINIFNDLWSNRHA